MTTVLRRPLVAFVLGAGLAAAAAAGTAAYAALSDERVTACYAAKTGALYVVGRDNAPAKCVTGDAPIDWSIRGPQGPAGTFSGTFTSPNGAYSISVTDSGITLAGPGGSVNIAGTSVDVESTGTANVRGAMVRLNGGSTCRPVARRDDRVSVPFVGALFPIAEGSASVCSG